MLFFWLGNQLRFTKACQLKVENLLVARPSYILRFWHRVFFPYFFRLYHRYSTQCERHG